MQYILTEEELFEERETLRAQLDDAVTLAAAKTLLNDALWKAASELSAPTHKLFLYHVDKASRELQEQFPKDSPVRAYFSDSVN